MRKQKSREGPAGTHIPKEHRDGPESQRPPHALPQTSTPGTSQRQWEMENSASEGAAELVESVTEPRCACTLGENDT